MRFLFGCLFIPFFSIALAQTTVYTTDFDTGDEGWANTGTNNWVRGDNSFGTGADGNYWGYPNDGANYGNSEYAEITSPVIDLSLYGDLTFSIDVRYEAVDEVAGVYYDGYNVEYSTDGGTNWSVLGSYGEGQNWYNQTDIDELGEDGWADDNDAWQTASITLPSDLEFICEARFRVIFASDAACCTDVGVAFDNVTITGTKVGSGPSVSLSPGDVSESLLLWMRSDSGVAYTSNNEVGSWEDWSGNGHIASDVGCTKPLYVEDAVNGHPAIQFDGNDDYLNLGDILDLQPSTDEWTFFSVFNTDATGTIFSRALSATEANKQYQFRVSGAEYGQIIGGTLSTGSAVVTGSWNISSTAINTGNLNGYINGTADISGATIGAATETTDVLIGARSDGAGFLYDGDLAELIVFYSELSASDIRDVETYLGIKYGISLDVSTTGYTLDGIEIFAPADLSGYQNDIAAIGIDDSQGLSQTSGESASGGIVEISNASDLSDGEFLFWGNDGGATTTTTGDVPGGIDNRVTRIWRVSETGEAGTVDISFDITSLGLTIRTFNLLTAPSGATIPTDLSSATVSAAGTISYVDGREIVTFSGVSIDNQEYFTLGVSDPLSPGGISSNLALWLKADAGITHSDNAVSDWSDQSGNGNDATESAGDYPTYVANAINGNPVVRFNANATSLQGTFDNNDGDWTFFLVGVDNDAATFSDDAFFEFRGGSGDDRYFYLDSRYASNNDFSSAIAQSAATLWRIDHSGNSADIFENSTSLESGYGTGFGTGTTGTFDYVLGDDDTGGNELDGDIAELLAYTTSTLTSTEIRDIETYLAIKYGISLDISASGYTVGGTDIYNYTTYVNDIAGIGRDDSQGLNQTSSTSESGGVLTFANASGLDDGEFLVWGHDGATTGLTTGDIPAGIDNRMTRVWRMDETGDVGTVDISFDLGTVGLVSGGTYYLIMSSSATMASGTVTSDPSLSGSVVTFSGIDVADGDYFTLGADDPPTPGGVSTNLALWLYAGTGITLNGNNVSDWADQSGNGNNAVQATADAQPEYLSEQLNGNAVLSFDGGDVLTGDAGFYTQEYFVVTFPNEIYNSGVSSGTIVSFETGEFARLGLGPTSAQIADEVITHSAGSGASYRGAFTSTSADLNQPAVINPRENAASTGHEIYYNGVDVLNAETNVGTYTNFNDASYEVGDEVGFTPSYPYNGTIAEIISYTSRLSDSDRRDVSTYMAIKYGITLDITSQAYTAGGTAIFDDTGYPNDIAGIGMSTASNLNQTSSKSVNSGSIVRIENASDLEDSEYLVWGNDGNVNDFTTNDVPPGNSERFEKIWTISEFGGDGVGTISISFDITSLGIDIDNSTINLFILATGSTIPDDFSGATVNSSGTISNANGRDIVTFDNVDFADGDYFTIGGDVQTASPGSSGLALWLRADQGITSSGNLVSNWSDQSGNGNDVLQGATSLKPTLVSDEINYNDAIYFNSDVLETINGFYTHDYFVVIKPDAAINNTLANGFVLGFETQAASGFYVGDQNIIGNDLFGQTLDTDGYDAAATASSISNDNAVIFNARNNAGASSQDLFANGSSFTVTTSGTFANVSDNPIRIGNNFDGDNAYEGYVAEVLSYSTRLTDNQRRDVESYLALKYGITLDVSSDAYTADSADVFAFTTYINDIAGIGIHLDYGLDQVQSVSQNTGAIIKMESAADLDDGEYVIWGNDGGSKTTPQSSELPAGYDERLPAEWRASVVGSPGTVTIKLYTGGIDNFSERPQTASLYELLIDTDGDFSTISSSVSASSLSNDTLTFSTVSLDSGNYFTLALPAQPDVTGLTLWLKADEGIEEADGNDAENSDLVEYWRDQSGNSNDVTQNTLARRPTYLTGSLNGNPVVNFDDGYTYMELAPTNLNPRSVFIVYRDTSTAQWATPFTNDDGDGIGHGHSDDSQLFNATYTPADVRNGDNYVDGTDIGDGTTQSRPDSYELHSRVFVSNLSDATHNYYVGIDRGFDDRSIDGDIAEIMVYTSALTDTERRDIETYLAIKYGLTLDIASLNYTYNSGTSIYSQTTYNNDIAGIGANSTYGLSQGSSQSISTDAIVTVSNASNLNNGDFLVWGNDNGATSETTGGVPPGMGDRMTRKWGVTETNNIGTVTVAFDLTGLGYSAKDVSDFSLIVDDNDDFTDGILRSYSAESFTSDVVTFSAVDFTGITHFGLGTTIDLLTDTDTDGIPDYFESAYGTLYNDGDDPVSGGAGGTDSNASTGINGDGISDALEAILISNGASAPVTVFTDTDGDGIPDYREVTDGSGPFNANSPTTSGDSDADGDGLPDALEVLINAEGGAADSDLSTDTDGDGVPDYTEIVNNTNPNDVNDPTTNGGNDSDGDGISDALEDVLLAGGAAAADTDTDVDGIPDYVEAQTYTDPFNLATPAAGINNVRTILADYEAAGGQCVDLSGYQWIDFTDQSGNLVFSINPFGNDLGSTCWGIRILNGESNVRVSGGLYYLNRNWYIEPTTPPSTNVYVRLYSLDQEATDLANRANNDYGTSESTADILAAMTVLKIDGDTDLDPLTVGGSSTNEGPTIVDFSAASADAFVLELSSFSSLNPEFDGESVLPIELLYFRARNSDKVVAIEWSTASELNNDFFTLERSRDGEYFTEIARVAGAGNSSQQLTYEFADRVTGTGIYFYRLKQTDFDGKLSYSDIIAINVTGGLTTNKLVVYPNPVLEQVFYVSTANMEFGADLQVSIMDLSGRTIKSQTLKPTLNNVLAINASDLQDGIYLLRIESGENVAEAKFIIDRQ